MHAWQAQAWEAHQYPPGWAWQQAAAQPSTWVGAASSQWRKRERTPEGKEQQTSSPSEEEEEKYEEEEDEEEEDKEEDGEEPKRAEESTDWESPTSPAEKSEEQKGLVLKERKEEKPLDESSGNESPEKKPKERKTIKGLSYQPPLGSTPLLQQVQQLRNLEAKGLKQSLRKRKHKSKGSTQRTNHLKMEGPG